MKKLRNSILMMMGLLVLSSIDGVFFLSEIDEVKVLKLKEGKELEEESEAEKRL